MKIRAFIFDIGNVLLRLDYGRAQRLLAQASAPAPDRRVLESLARDYERGRMDSAHFLSALSEAFSGSVSGEILLASWQDIFEPNGPMWEVVSALYGRFPLYLLSNTNALHHDAIVERYEVFEKFADGVFSYQEGLLKPEPEIFALAIRRFGVRPEETCYIDDLAPNVEGACAAGLRGIHYDADAHGEFTGTLRGLGVECL